MIAPIVCIVLIIILGNLINKTINSTTKNNKKGNLKEPSYYSGLDLKVNEDKIKEIQNNELNTERFKKINSFIDMYDNRKNLKLELELLKLTRDFNIDASLSNKVYNQIKTSQLEKFNKIKEFIDNLSEDELNSNIILKSAKKLLISSYSDCNKIFKKLIQEYNNLEVSDDVKKIEIEYNIPKERQDDFPVEVPEQIDELQYDLNTQEDSYIYVLDIEYQHIYSKYNDYVRKMMRFATEIYSLQMWNILSNYTQLINSYDFIIRNNGIDSKFIVRFTIKKALNDAMIAKVVDEEAKVLLESDKPKIKEYTNRII